MGLDNLSTSVARCISRSAAASASAARSFGMSEMPRERLTKGRRFGFGRG